MKSDFQHADPATNRLAVSVLQWLTKDEDRLDAFLQSSGLSPSSLREAARDPGFLTAVLDYVVQDENGLIACAKALGIRPEAIAAAWRRLQPPEFDHSS